VENGTVCIYDDKPLSYIKLVTYGKASASSIVKATLPRTSFMYIKMISLPCILVQTGTSQAYLANLQASCVRFKDGIHSLY